MSRSLVSAKSTGGIAYTATERGEPRFALRTFIPHEPSAQMTTRTRSTAARLPSLASASSEMLRAMPQRPVPEVSQSRARRGGHGDEIMLGDR